MKTIVQCVCLLLASAAVMSFLLASTNKNFECMAFNVFVLITILIIIAIPCDTFWVFSS